MATSRPMQEVPKVRTRDSANTMRRYLDAAEALFIRLGYEGASIRAISARAKMNLATVVYHWGTKEALFRAVCLRRFAPIEEEQMARLRACNAHFDDLGPADLETVLRALVEPPLKVRKSAKSAQNIRLLYGRVLTDPSPVVLRVTAEIFAEPTDLFRRLVRQCVPHLEEDVFFWRYTCALGAFIFTQSFGYRIAYAANLDDRNADWAKTTDEIVAFMVAGLLNP